MSESSPSPLATAVAHHIDRHPRFWLALLAIMTLGLAAGLLRLKIDNSVEALLSQDTPTSQAFRIFAEVFGNGELAIVAFRDEAGILRPEVLAELEGLTARIETSVPFEDGVVSLTNLPVVAGDDGALVVRPLLDETARVEIARVETVVAGEPIVDWSLGTAGVLAMLQVSLADPSAPTAGPLTDAAAIAQLLLLCDSGFLVLTQSGFYPNFAFGTLSALTVTVAVISDLTLCYATWTLIGRRRERAAA